MKAPEKTKISNLEYSVLKCLKGRRSASRQAAATEIAEISFTTGIKDNDEVLRALYTLEGKNLVEPEPQGDFTSNVWQITDIGVHALDLFEAEA